MKWCATRRGKGLTNWKPSGKRKIDCRNDSRPRLAALANTARERGAQTLAVPSKSQNGKKAGPRDYRGKFVVLNFWATWCVPCREEMPMLVEVEKEYAPRNVVFIAASLDDRQSRPKIPEFIDKKKVGFTVLTGASTMDLDDLKLGQALPATAFLDRDGRIVFRARFQQRFGGLNARAH